MRSLLLTSLRLLVTAGLLWVLLARADLGHIKEVVGHVSLPLLAAGAAALLTTSPFSALRWHVVLAAETTSPGPWTLLKIVLVGLFFNQVLPSGSRSHRIYSRVSGSVSTEEASPANSISFSLSWLAPEISNTMRC